MDAPPLTARYTEGSSIARRGRRRVMARKSSCNEYSGIDWLLGGVRLLLVLVLLGSAAVSTPYIRPVYAPDSLELPPFGSAAPDAEVQRAQS